MFKMNIASLRNTLSDLLAEAEDLASDAGNLDTSDAADSVGNLQYEIENAISSATESIETLNDSVSELQGTAGRIESTLRDLLADLDEVEQPEESGEVLLRKAIAKLIAEALETQAKAAAEAVAEAEVAVESKTPVNYGYVG